MNKTVFTLLIFSLAMQAHAQEVIVHSSNSTTLENEQVGGNILRSPIYIPSVFLSNHTLSFERCCIGSQIEVVQNGNVVYSTFITNEDGTVELPPYIIGECELRLRWGGFLFEGEFIIQ